MVYKLKIFIIPSNKKHTKLNPDGEYFKKSMIEEPKPKAKPKPEAKPSAQNSEPKKGGANEQKENSKEKPKPKAKPKPPKINLIIKKPIVKKLTYWEKTLALDFLKDTKWKNKLILQFPDDPDPHKHFKNIILKFNKEDKEKPPEYKSAEITELFQFIAKCNKEPFRLFDSQVDAMFKLIDERLKKIFKKDTKVTRKYTFKKKTKPKPKPKGKPKPKEKPKPKPPPEHEKILICGFTWKLNEPPENKDTGIDCELYEKKGFQWHICTPKSNSNQADAAKKKWLAMKKIIDAPWAQDKGLHYFDALAEIDEEILRLNEMYHDGDFKTRAQEKYRHNIVEKIVQYNHDNYKILSSIDENGTKKEEAEEALTYFKKFQAKAKQTNKFPTFKYLYYHVLSCFDSQFRDSYLIFNKRRELTKKKILQLKKTMKSSSTHLFYRAQHELNNIELIFKAELVKVKHRMRNQAKWRQVFIKNLKEKDKLISKIIRIDILTGEYKTGLINVDDYYKQLDDVDEKIKIINEKFRKKEPVKEKPKAKPKAKPEAKAKPKPMTLEQRRKKINDIIEDIREENDEKDFIVSRQSVEIAKLPNFPPNWRRKCNIHPYKWGNQIKRETLIKSDWHDPVVRSQIVSIIEDWILENPSISLSEIILKFEGARPKQPLQEFAKMKGFGVKDYTAAYEPLFKEAKQLALRPPPKPKPKGKAKGKAKGKPKGKAKPEPGKPHPAARAELFDIHTGLPRPAAGPPPHIARKQDIRDKMAAILPKRSADNIDAAAPPPPPAFRRAHTQGGGAEDALDKKLRLARENAMAKIHPPPKPEYVERIKHQKYELMPDKDEEKKAKIITHKMSRDFERELTRLYLKSFETELLKDIRDPFAGADDNIFGKSNSADKDDTEKTPLTISLELEFCKENCSLANRLKEQCQKNKQELLATLTPPKPSCGKKVTRVDASGNKDISGKKAKPKGRLPPYASIHTDIPKKSGKHIYLQEFPPGSDHPPTDDPYGVQALLLHSMLTKIGGPGGIDLPGPRDIKAEKDKKEGNRAILELTARFFYQILRSDPGVNLDNAIRLFLKPDGALKKNESGKFMFPTLDSYAKSKKQSAAIFRDSYRPAWDRANEMIHTLHPTQQKLWNDLLEIQKKLPHGWVARYDGKREKVFYYNFISNQKTYQIPLYARDEFGLPLSRAPAVRKMDPVWPSEADLPFTENDPKAGEWKGAEYMTNIAKNESMSPQQAEWARRKQEDNRKREKQSEDLQKRLDALGGGTRKRRRRRRRRTLKKF